MGNASATASEPGWWVGEAAENESLVNEDGVVPNDDEELDAAERGVPRW